MTASMGWRDRSIVVVVDEVTARGEEGWSADKGSEEPSECRGSGLPSVGSAVTNKNYYSSLKTSTQISNNHC